MEEFRRVHRKMFSTFSSEEDGEREKEEESNNKPNFHFFDILIESTFASLEKDI